VVRSLPKVLLHDHLDGGLRPTTVVELADAGGYDDLPTTDPEQLAAHLHSGADRRDLNLYLEMFRHTVGVMQTAEALARVAYESVHDLAADGVVYVETRFAPELHTAKGLTEDAVVEAVLDGLARGERDTGTVARVIIDTIRSESRSDRAVEVAIAHADRGVVAFDLSGPEDGFPASDHERAIRRAIDAGLHVTIHAGEGHGLASIRDALDVGAERLGHGVRLIDDIGPDRALGPTARRVIDAGVVLEVCPSSNVHTGAAASIADHPIERLRVAGVQVTVNTDNRLMSDVTMTDELVTCAAAFGWDARRLRELTLVAVGAAFCDEEVRRGVAERVRSGYDRLSIAT
jgi:adenosine deaminase